MLFFPLLLLSGILCLLLSRPQLLLHLSCVLWTIIFVLINTHLALPLLSVFFFVPQFVCLLALV